MTRISINKSAPAYATREAVVDAPVQLVWSTLVDLEKWPEWNESVQNIDVQGGISPGTEFRWISGGTKIRSRIEEVDPPNRIVWSGRTMGIKAMHSWEFSTEQPGTRIRTEESFEGLIALLLAKQMRRVLSDALEQALEALKKEAEKRYVEEKA